MKHFRKKNTLVGTALTLFAAMLVSAGARAEITYTATAGTAGYDGESYPNLVDGDKTNKWCCNPLESAGTTTAFIEFQSSEPITPKGYVITTANDTKESPDRNPKKWTIMAKMNVDDAEWTVLVAVTNESRLPAANFEDCIYGIANNTAYQYFRLEITELQSYCFQLAEFAFLTEGIDDKDLSMAKIMGLESNYGFTGSAIDLSSVYVVDICENTIAPAYYKTVITNSSDEEVTSVIERGGYTLTIVPVGDTYHGSVKEAFTVSLWAGEGGFCGKPDVNGGQNLYYEVTNGAGGTMVTIKKNPYVAATSDFGIGDDAFRGNGEINVVTIEEGVTSIGICSFRNCYNLNSVSIPEGLTLIDNGAFYLCSNLTSIHIPASVTSIGTMAFFTVRLAAITVASGNTKYKIDGNCLIETATNTLLLGCDNSVIPTTVTNIGSNAFYACYDLTSITLPEGLTTISMEAFNKCALTSITIPAGVTSIGEGAFTYCSDIADVYCYANPDVLTWKEGIYDFSYRLHADRTKVHVFDVADWSAYDSWTHVQFVGDLVLEFANGADNLAAASKWDGQKVNVKLDGRTLIQDGGWNTLCVPFDVTLADSPLAGAEARTLTAASFDTGVLTLTFGDPVTTLVAGTPYIIKWAEGGSDIVDPLFEGVTIDETLRDFVSADTKVSFLGTYLMCGWVGDNKDNLAMGANNTLYNPLDGAQLPCFSAYFAVEVGSDAPILRTVMNFGDGTTGIVSHAVDSEEMNVCFDLSGRRIIGSAAAKGIYIVNGKKVVVR